jgi:hypothetical protein
MPIEHAAAQSRSAIKARGVKKAGEELDFLRIGSASGLSRSLVASLPDACQRLSMFCGFFLECEVWRQKLSSNVDN